MTDIELCSWPATTDSMPMKSGLSRSAERYSTTGYWNSCSDCQRHMFWFGAVPVGLPLTCTGGLLFCQLVFGPRIVVPSAANSTGYAGVASDASSTSVQLRLP